MGCGWVAGWLGGFMRIMPRCGSILQAGTCHILRLAENPRWSRVWQYLSYVSISEFNITTCNKEVWWGMCKLCYNAGRNRSNKPTGRQAWALVVCTCKLARWQALFKMLNIHFWISWRKFESFLDVCFEAKFKIFIPQLFENVGINVSFLVLK